MLKKSRFGSPAWAHAPSTRKRNSKNILNQDLPIFKTVADPFGISSLYEGRWLIEPDIGSIKCTMNLEHLRAQIPEGIELELWTGLLTYNLVRIKMRQSGYAANREIRSMSFTET